ncbi:MAG: RHS repeat protein, partial [Tannerellaceae bacterium]|nr:RHS repeat protein [Tannerellaceae bacterium]
MASSSTGSRGFGEMFSEKKAQLDGLQAKLASKLPSIPGMPVSKFYDISIGVDLHPTILPPSYGVPVPVPHTGMIYDIMAAVMASVASALPSAVPPAPSGGAVASALSAAGNVALNLLKGMAPSVKVHGRWIGQAGISIQHLPAYVIHALPTVPPMASSEMWMGSTTVLADGAPCSAQFHPALSCNIVGFPSVFRKGKPPKPKVSLMAPLAMLTTIVSAGKPVLVGGPPTIDLFQLGMKLGLKGLGKAWKKIGDKFQNVIDTKVKNPKLKKVLQPVKCRLFGEPIDVAS